MMELSLDLRLDNCYYYYVPQMVKENESQRLDDFLKRLEDERRKIQVFKRELPLSMLLLNHTILRLREKVKSEEGDDGCDKKDWMSSFQLWNVVDDNKCHTNSGDQKVQGSREEDNDRSTCENPIQVLEHRRAFVPYKAEAGLERGKRKQEREITSVAEMGSSYLASRNNCTASFQMKSGAKRRQQQEASKRQRRCWSLQLHQSFVDAIEQLGGSHVATPKQIKDLMQVDGLTNDEVKSHLQKYRLHIRKHPSSSAALENHGLCLNRDKSKDHSEATVSQSSSPLDPSGSTKRASNGNIEDEVDEKSESHSWNGGSQRSAEFDV